MFGYLQPCKPYLMIKDFEMYKSVYCGLCKKLGEEYGIFARLALSYDCTCYSVIAMGLRGECEGVYKKRCVFNPLKKCFYCKSGNSQLSLAAAVTIASAYYKLEDTVRDSRFFKSAAVRFLKLFLKRPLKKVEKNYPEIAYAVKQLNISQKLAEQSNNPSLDEAAEPTAIMLKKLMLILAETEKEKLVFGEFGYFLGKWIYLMDAADDYEKDMKNNSFNPFAITFKNKSFSEKEITLYMNEVINLVAARVSAAYSFMEIKSFKVISDNIINMGLGQMQKKIIFDKKKKSEKKSRQINRSEKYE